AHAEAADPTHAPHLGATDEGGAGALGLPVPCRHAEDLGRRRAHDARVDLDDRFGGLAAEAAEADDADAHAAPRRPQAELTVVPAELGDAADDDRVHASQA